MAAQSAAEKPDNVQLQTAIAEAMRTSPLTANHLIVVHVNQGAVTLEGAAMSPFAPREATHLAETVLGVKAIRNRLSVVNTQTAEIFTENIAPQIFSLPPNASGMFPCPPGKHPALAPSSAR